MNSSMELTEETLLRIQQRVDKLKTSKFKQQALASWKPVPTYSSAAFTMFLFGIIFFIPGIFLYAYSDKVR